MPAMNALTAPVAILLVAAAKASPLLHQGQTTPPEAVEPRHGHHHHHHHHDSDVAFPCDVECIKKEAKRMGADVMTPVDQMKFSMDVMFSAAADAGEACGDSHTFPAFDGLHLNPGLQLKLTTTDTRETPQVTFQCSPGKYYHLILNDSMGGPFQLYVGYTHWVHLNMLCPAAGVANLAEAGGEDIDQGRLKGYLTPSFPDNTFHHFNYYLFETAMAFDAARIEKLNTDLPAHNQLVGVKWNIQDVIGDLGFAPPVARTWMDVTTSYWSEVNWHRPAPIGPGDAAIAEAGAFVADICRCQLDENRPGLGKRGLLACGN